MCANKKNTFLLENKTLKHMKRKIAEQHFIFFLYL